MMMGTECRNSMLIVTNPLSLISSALKQYSMGGIYYQFDSLMACDPWSYSTNMNHPISLLGEQAGESSTGWGAYPAKGREWRWRDWIMVSAFILRELELTADD